MENSEIVEVIEETKPQDIDLSLVKSYMKIDFEDEETDKMLEMFLISAKSFTQTYLGWKFSEVEDIPCEITIAILAITEHWYKNKGILNEDATRKELPYVFAGILDMHRDWQVGEV